MSAIGTDRLCQCVRKHFRYWKFSRNAAAVPVLLSLTRYRHYDRGQLRRQGVRHQDRHACARGAPAVS
jgi:hypothetical protein